MLRAAYTHALPGVVFTNLQDPVCCTLISPMSPYSIHSGSGPRSWVLTVISLCMPFKAIPSGTSWCEEAAALRSFPLVPLSAPSFDPIRPACISALAALGRVKRLDVWLPTQHPGRTDCNADPPGQVLGSYASPTGTTCILLIPEEPFGGSLLMTSPSASSQITSGISGTASRVLPTSCELIPESRTYYISANGDPGAHAQHLLLPSISIISRVAVRVSSSAGHLGLSCVRASDVARMRKRHPITRRAAAISSEQPLACACGHRKFKYLLLLHSFAFRIQLHSQRPFGLNHAHPHPFHDLQITSTAAA